MGTLSDLGILSDGELGTSAKTAFKDQVVLGVNSGIALGSTALSAGKISLGDFATGSIDYIEENYPAWYGVYINGFLVNIAKFLDGIPDAGILKVFGIFDPTKPLLLIIKELKELIDKISALLSFPLIDIILEKLATFLSYANEFLEKINKIIDDLINSLDPTEAIEEFFETLKSAISKVLEEAGEAIDSVIQKLEESKEEIKEKLLEIFQKIVDALNLELPSFSLPSLSLDFLSVDLTPPLFAVKEVDGFDGIATIFAKMMAAFITVPSKLVEAAKSAIETLTGALQKFVSAIFKILTDTANAIKEIFEALLEFVWSLISPIIDLAEVAFLQISSIINVVIFFVKYLVVSIIGFLIGSGLIAYSAAQFLEIL